MTDIRPFRGIHYNGSLLKDWPAAICPPYDIITPGEQQELHSRREYNFVRLEFGRELPSDTDKDNKYTRAAATLEQWLKQGILDSDKTPALYLHDHYFTHQGKQYRRRGITARIRLEDWDKLVVRPHESTLTEPRNDRLNLLRALQVNTSPILAMYQDRGGQISAILAHQEKNKPLITLNETEGEGHTVRAITEPDAIKQVTACLAEQPVYIADGHHRYESALTYQRERRAGSPTTTGEEPFNFVMMTLVDFADPGLIVLAPHRLVRGISNQTREGLRAKLELLCEIRELPLDTRDVWQQVDDFLRDTTEVRFILFGLAADRLCLMRLPDPSTASQMMPQFHSKLYQRLDVSITDHIILEKLLSLSNDKEKSSLSYSYDRLEAVNRVLSQEYQLAIILRPIKPEIIKAVADAGDKMPRKSTYFYPKSPAGLIFNRLV